MTMTSFPGSTFSWQSNIYTYAFIYYNLHPVPKGVGVWVRLCLSPAVPASSPTSFLVAPIIIHRHPHGSSPPRHAHHPPPSTFHLPTATESRPIIKKVLPLCYFLSCHAHNRLIFSLISPWVLTPQGSHAHFTVHLVRFSSRVVQNPALCGIKSPPMWYNLCLHATSRTNPEPIPKEGEAMKSHENKPKND